MPRYFLYYAGMAADLVNEQIGLAVSDDGLHFSRVGRTGLVLPRDEALDWCSLRVCNPTVLADRDGFTMYYQGIARGDGGQPPHTSIGRAGSPDGVDWAAERDPIVSWQAMAEHDPDLDVRKRVGVTAPSVLEGELGRRMWFVYIHESTPGNALYYAEEDGAGVWHVREPVLAGADFPGLEIHYPLVEHDAAGYVLSFTLRDSRRLHGIFRMRSSDGRSWEGLEPILPRRRPLEPSMYLRLHWRLPARIKFRLLSGRGALGYAHPHYVRNGGTTMYYHAANLGPDGLWLDIGRCELGPAGCRSHRAVLEPARDPDAWDAFFVGDPFVLVVPE